LLPVAIHYLLSFSDELTGISKFITKPLVLQVQRVLAVYSYLVVVLVVVANLSTSNSFLQAMLTIIFLPLFLPLFFVFFDQKQFLQFRIKKIIDLSKLPFKRFEKSQQAKSTEVASQIIQADSQGLDQPIDDYELSSQENQVVELATGRTNSAVLDAQKRQFLKIVGGGGTSLLLMLFFMPKQASAAFFGSTPGPGIVGVKDSGGNKIDPAEKQPVDGYLISEIDDADATSYYGFVNQDGAWYIAREDNLGSYRYAAGASSFSTNWANRKTTMTYGYFDDVF
jgi:hypothetical protein